MSSMVGRVTIQAISFDHQQSTQVIPNYEFPPSSNRLLATYILIGIEFARIGPIIRILSNIHKDLNFNLIIAIIIQQKILQ